MNSHLVTIKVSVERSTDQWMNLNSLALYKHRLKSLNTKTVKSRCPVEHNRSSINNFFKYVPDNRIFFINKFLC